MYNHHAYIDYICPWASYMCMYTMYKDLLTKTQCHTGWPSQEKKVAPEMDNFLGPQNFPLNHNLFVHVQWLPGIFSLSAGLY